MAEQRRETTFIIFIIAISADVSHVHPWNDIYDFLNWRLMQQRKTEENNNGIERNTGHTCCHMRGHQCGKH